MAKERYFVEKITSIAPNKSTGIVKLTFAVSDNGKDDEVVEIVVAAGNLHEIFQEVGQKMQKTFGGMGGPGGPGGPKLGGPGKKGGGTPFAGFKDLTKD